MGASLLVPRGRVTITPSGEGGAIYISTCRKFGFSTGSSGGPSPRLREGPRGFASAEVPSSEFAYMAYFLKLPSGEYGRDGTRCCRALLQNSPILYTV